MRAYPRAVVARLATELMPSARVTPLPAGWLVVERPGRAPVVCSGAAALATVLVRAGGDRLAADVAHLSPHRPLAADRRMFPSAAVIAVAEEGGHAGGAGAARTWPPPSPDDRLVHRVVAMSLTLASAAPSGYIVLHDERGIFRLQP